MYASSITYAARESCLGKHDWNKITPEFILEELESRWKVINYVCTKCLKICQVKEKALEGFK